MAYDYENEEPTDEARTNEEAYEEMQQQFGTTKYGNFMKGKEKIANGGCVFFNEGIDDEQSNDCSSDQEEEEEEEDEEGEFDPTLIAG
jgi:hypothetical protein